LAGIFGSKSFSSFSFDVRGVGESEGDFEDGSLNNRLVDAENALQTFIATGKVDQKHLAVGGNSMGAHIVVRLIEKNPWVKAIMLGCAAAYGTEAEDKKLNKTFTEVLRKENSWQDSRVFPILKAYKGKILVLYGEEEVVIPREVQKKFVEIAQKKGEAYYLANIGHKLLQPGTDLQKISFQKILKISGEFLEKIFMKNPIGILDSGLGGLTVWREIVSLLPNENTIYVADSKNTPYGKHEEEYIYQLSKKLIEFLLQKEVKLIVVACNTITVSALEKLRQDYPNIPIIGTVPVVKTAAASTKNGRIGILSTTRTATSLYQKDLIKRFANDKMVVNYGTDALVPLIEEGEVDGRRIEKTLKRALEVFKREKVDVLALGCTHFPFLKEQMQAILGSDVAILDSGAAIARQVRRVLEHNGALAEKQQAGHLFYTTGDPQIAKKLVISKIGSQMPMDFENIIL